MPDPITDEFPSGSTDSADLMRTSPPTPARPRVRRRAVLWGAAASGLLAACGSPQTRPDPSSAPSATAEGAAAVDPAAFAARVRDTATFVLNVHTPDEGSIAGTDAAIPYDQLRERVGELPMDRSTPVAVYCMSGRMSAVAVPTLQALGFTQVTELRGGMVAWQASGRRLLAP